MAIYQQLDDAELKDRVVQVPKNENSSAIVLDKEVCDRRTGTYPSRMRGEP